jgi:hypothetical protein
LCVNHDVWSHDAVRENKPSDGTVGTNTLILRDVLDGALGNVREITCPESENEESRQKPAFYQFRRLLLQRLP